jgi:3-deoxy-manno-octulosonate cytidylyltransferase (CMP-KDO synthetase)
MKTAVVIPARFGSTRLPGKPLLRETGKYLIQHVYERACQSRADRVIVATDDERIAQAVRGFGGSVALTRADHPSGTDRVAEVARTLDVELVVNLQGDEPQLPPAYLDLLPDLLRRDLSSEVATLAAPITSLEQWQDPACVKVVRDSLGRALYFSRSPIPHVRDGRPTFGGASGPFLQHIGIYAYRLPFLLHLAAQPPAPLEELEKLEQLRVLSLGRHIHVGVVSHAARGVDTPSDYARFVREYRQSAGERAA